MPVAGGTGKALLPDHGGWILTLLGAVGIVAA